MCFSGMVINEAHKINNVKAAYHTDFHQLKLPVSGHFNHVLGEDIGQPLHHHSSLNAMNVMLTKGIGRCIASQL